MASRLSDSMLEPEEHLFWEIMNGPLTGEGTGMLDDLLDVDARGFRQRTLLHVAVRLGRKDWTEALLSRGADPSIRDAAGDDVLKVAKDMSTKHPGDACRKEILGIVVLVHKWGAARSLRSTTVGGGAVSSTESGCRTEMDVMAEVRSLSEKVESMLMDFSGHRVVLGKLEESVTSTSQQLETSKEEWRSIDTALKSFIGDVNRKFEAVMLKFDAKHSRPDSNLFQSSPPMNPEEVMMALAV